MKTLITCRWLAIVALVSLLGTNVFATSPVGSWKFDTGSGLVATDSSGNGYNGTLSGGMGAANWVSGRLSYGLNFNGAGNYVFIANNTTLSPTAAVTVEAWVKPDTLPINNTYGAIVGKGPYTYWLTTYNGRAAMLIGKSDRSGWNIVAVGETLLTSGRWYHLAGTYEDGVVKLYVNGTLDRLSSGSIENIGSYTYGVTIGQANSGNYFDGVIDEVKIYNQALSESEIQTSLTCGLWHFDEASGTSLTDSSGKGNTGTLAANPNAPIRLPGYSGTALDFDGTDYATAANSASLNISSEVTIEGWVIPDTSADYHMIASKGPYTYWLTTFGNKVKLLVGKQNSSPWNATVIGTTPLDNTKWYHLAGTYKNGIGKVYVNGILDGTSVDGTDLPIYTNASMLYIGKSSTLAYPVNGTIDELKIHNRALSDWEMLKQYLAPDAKCSLEFDQVSGLSAPDTSGYNNNGTLNSMTAPACWVDGRVGKALQFDGVNDYVSVPNAASLNFTTEMTAEAWVKPDGRAGLHVIACKGSYTYFLAMSDAKPVFYVSINGTSYITAIGTATLDSSKWYHIVGTYKGGMVKLYVNGINVTTVGTPSSANIYTKTSALSIGSASSYNPTYYFQGAIDQLNLFSKEMTLAQIANRFIAHGGQYGFGCEEQSTGNPVGGGAGYTDIKTTGNYTVSTKAALKSALLTATAGQTIYVSGDIDLTGETELVIKSGVTLAGNRGAGGTAAGPNLHVDSNPSTACALFVAGGTGVRITGLRLTGPDPNVGTDPYSPPTMDGIKSGYSGLQVDNCVISGWAHAGVYLINGGTAASIRHNYFHHCQRTGLGYGVCVNSESNTGSANATIEGNKFDYMRHSIAASGWQNDSYEARYNLVEQNSIGHAFDVHGGADRGDGTTIAGNTITIHHNTVKALTNEAVRLRGIPYNKATINNNWFVKYGVNQINAQGKMETYRNLMRVERTLDKNSITP